MQAKDTATRNETHPTTLPRLSGIKLVVAALMFSLAGAVQTAHAQAAPTAAMPATVSPAIGDTSTPAPAASDIVAMLRKQFRVAPADSMRIAQAVLTEASRYAMSPMLLLAVMSVESGFDRHAVSSVGAMGLMQVLPAAHPHLLAGGRDLTDPAVNVRIGSAILRGYLDAAGGDLDAALRRYSGGSRGYTARVVMRMRRFDERFSVIAGRTAGASLDALNTAEPEVPGPLARVE